MIKFKPNQKVIQTHNKLKPKTQTPKKIKPKIKYVIYPNMIDEIIYHITTIKINYL